MISTFAKNMLQKILNILILLGLFWILSNSSRLPKDNSNLAFVSFLGKLVNVNDSVISSPDSAPQVVSTDFVASINATAPTSQVVISKTQTLGVTFDKPMSASDCVATMNGVAIQTTNTASSDLKTIFFKPVTGWTVDMINGVTINLSSACKSSTGSAYVPGAGVLIFVAGSTIYVDGTAGSDTNPGTITSPLKTISIGVTTIASSCSVSDPCAILVKGGIYTISSSITIPSNLAIFGGYDPADWKVRRADKTSLPPYDTVLNDSSTGVSGIISNPYSTLNFSNTTGINIIDGLIINGNITATASSFVSPIAITNLQTGATLSIRNSILKDVSSSPSVTSAGLIAYNNSGIINVINSQVLGSTALAASERHALYYNISNTNSVITVTNSILDAGYSNINSSGFFMAASSNGNINLSNNVINGAICNVCNSIGITANFATPNGMTISQNTITTRTGNNSIGINFTSGTGLSILNNIITTGTATNQSIGINLVSNTSTLTASNNTLSAGSCTAAGCVAAGIYSSTSLATLNVNSNTISAGSCSGSACFTYGIYLGNSATATNTTISGNTLSLGSATTGGSYGMYFTSTSANQSHTISGNTFTGGTASGGQISGIYRANSSAGATVTISNNVVTTGNCSGSCINRAFDIQNVSGTTTISGNTVTAGLGVGQSIGIELNNSSFTVSNNTITAGTCTGGSCISRGINSGFGSPVTITGNTVTAGTCSGATCNQTGINLAIGSNPVITLSNNTVDAGTPSVNTTSRLALNLTNWANGTSIQRNTFINRIGAGIPTTVRLGAMASSLTFCSNVLVGGGTNSAVTATTLEIGLITGVSKFKGNTIIGASATSGTVYPVNFLTTGTYTNLALDQNIIAGDPASSAYTTGIRESGAVIYSFLSANNLSCVSTLYNENGIIRNFLCTATQIGNFSSADALCSSGNLANPTGVNNTNLLPVFVNPSINDYHLNAATPVGITQAMTAAELSTFTTDCGNSLDRDGNTRTANSSIGAYR